MSSRVSIFPIIYKNSFLELFTLRIISICMFTLVAKFISFFLLLSQITAYLTIISTTIIIQNVSTTALKVCVCEWVRLRLYVWKYVFNTKQKQSDKKNMNVQQTRKIKKLKRCLYYVHCMIQ